jgi:acetate kinase
VHGGIRLFETQRVTEELVAEIRRNVPLDRSHLPGEIALIEALGRKLPGVLQVVCFDTLFHRDLPRVAQVLPIPREYTEAGVRRLGFHGLSYAYLMGELRRTAGDAAADGRVLLAHLGSGASLAAVRGGRPVDTSMAFTPTAGLVMGTRPGDLDPGLLVHIAREEGLDADGLETLVDARCGLGGISGGISDMRDLERSSDPRAAEAIAVFCYQAAKWIGAFAAVLGGIDTLVFSGGIGERSSEVRRRICSSLSFLGLEINGGRNDLHAAVISSERSRVTIRVIPTDEEIMIARETLRVLETP